MKNKIFNLNSIPYLKVVGLMSEVIADISQSVFTNETNTDSNQPSYLKLWYEDLNR